MKSKSLIIIIISVILFVVLAFVAKYILEPCDGINTYKIILDGEIYYIKEGCKEIQIGKKQAKITDEDFDFFKKILEDYI